MTSLTKGFFSLTTDTKTQLRNGGGMIEEENMSPAMHQIKRNIAAYLALSDCETLEVRTYINGTMPSVHIDNDEIDDLSLFPKEMATARKQLIQFLS